MTALGSRPRFRYRRSADQDASRPIRHPVVIAGGGMVGLTLALELIAQGIRPVVLERNDTVSEGSRSICQAKRSLEIWNRFNEVGDRIRERGATWNTGKVFFRDALLYEFNLLPEGGHQMPAFVNLQQYLVEAFLIEELLRQGGDVRWLHACGQIVPHDDHVDVAVVSSEGPYQLEAEWLIACDGAGSGIRKQLGLTPAGEVFADKFLITDVRMRAELPAERRFWFEPPFHSGQTALLHRQADDIWRIDLQLGPDADAEVERDLDRVSVRVRNMLGPDIEFEIEWTSLYAFQCRTLDRYVHGRVIFAGDSAHQVSPFGARGGNAGIQDANNLAWKLARLCRGSAGLDLLDSYQHERIEGARLDILHSTRATDFMSPRTSASRAMRNAALLLAHEDPGFRSVINSGRLSVPAHFVDSPLSTVDRQPFPAPLGPGSPAVDAPLEIDGRKRWLLSLLGTRFTLLASGPGSDDLPDVLSASGEPIDVVRVGTDRCTDAERFATARYGLEPGTCYLFRPDQYVAARTRRFDPAWLDRAVNTALARS